MDNFSQHGMTALMFQYATSQHLTLAEAKKHLQEDAYLRPAADVITKYCTVGGDDSASLQKRITSLLITSDPNSKKESIERKVRIWFNNKIQYLSKKSALQLIFALQLPLDEAEELLWRLSGEKFHWRDPKDIVWLFAIAHEMNYREACALLTRLDSVCQLPKNTIDDLSTRTESIMQIVRQLQTEEELQAFLIESAPRLGRFHNTAYSLFMDFINLLKTAQLNDLMPADRQMTISEIVTTYLYNNLIPRTHRISKKKDSSDDILKDAIQRDIHENWPDEFALSRMINRQIDVTRKVLILLFLACDGGESDYGDFSEGTCEDIFEDSYARLSTMLSDCGFPPLDSRIPFDWMVLYCMTTDDRTGIDRNISDFLSEIFHTPSNMPADDSL